MTQLILGWMLPALASEPLFPARERPATFEAIGLHEYRAPEPGHVDGGILGVPSDPDFVRQWGLYNDGAEPPAVAGIDVGALAAWETPGASRTIVVAVIDSGVVLGHPDGPIWWQNPGEIAGNGLDDDANGYVDDVNGYDFEYRDPVPDDQIGHGMNVASQIGAQRDNGLQVAGLCGTCVVMPLKAVDDAGLGDYARWAEALVYAVDNGADVVNVSLGGTSPSAVLRDAVAYAESQGVVVLAAAGNEDADVAYFPAATDGVIGVAGVDVSGARAAPWRHGFGGSSYGAHVDVCAPGDGILGLGLGEGLSTWSGSSQASALASGVLGLGLTASWERSPNEVAQALLRSARDQVGRADEDLPGWDPFHGSGLVAADRLLRHVDLDGDGVSSIEGDCDDADPLRAPLADELCNGMDDDCDGQVDEQARDALEWFADADGDGFGGVSLGALCEAPADAVTAAGDCDDAEAGVHIAAVEQCNGGDDNCDGRVDEGCETGACGCTYDGRSTPWLAGLAVVLLARRRRVTAA